MNKFIKQLCLLTFIIIVASIFARNILTIWWPAILGFFFVVSIVMFYLSEKVKQKGMRQFANFYMAATVTKVVLYLTVIVVYVMCFKEDGKRFAITFLAIYLIYSIFETIQLAKKKKNE